MASKCINYDCPIVKLYGQICTTQYPEGKEYDNVARPYTFANNKPVLNNGRYTCYQFGD